MQPIRPGCSNNRSEGLIRDKHFRDMPVDRETQVLVGIQFPETDPAGCLASINVLNLFERNRRDREPGFAFQPAQVINADQLVIIVK